MARTSRVPYHQNVYDLLGIEPGVCPDAARMIADHEAQHGPLPASVKEWYLVPKAVPLTTGLERNRRHAMLWHVPSDSHLPQSLESVLSQFARVSTRESLTRVGILDEYEGLAYYLIEVDGSDDPPVWRDETGPRGRNLRTPDSATFSDFIADWLVLLYWDRRWFPPPARLANPRGTLLEHSLKPYANGLWLRAPGAPFVPAAIDYLTEQLHDPERTSRPGDVTTYTFKPTHGTIRVTADAPDHAGALAAWWVHAETPERLAELARLVVPFTQLQADTDPAREVLKAVS